MQEIWKDIRGYEGKYKISTYGNVYSYKRKIYISQSKGANKLSASQVFAIRSEYKKGVRGKGYKSLAKNIKYQIRK